MKLPIISLLVLMLCVSACTPKPFFEDQDDPGLTRFTDRGLNAGSAYINGNAWRTGYSSLIGQDALLVADTNAVGKDTLYLSFQGEYSPALLAPSGWQNLPFVIFALPTKKNLTLNEWLSWNGRLFPADTTTVTVYLCNSPLPQPGLTAFVRGTGSLYFTKLFRSTNPLEVGMVGLFDGKIGDSIEIRKGRFDFRLNESSFTFTP